MRSWIVCAFLWRCASSDLCDPSCVSGTVLSPDNQAFLSLARNALTGRLYDEVVHCRGETWSLTHTYNHEKALVGNEWPVVGHTMVGYRRLQNIEDAIKHAVASGIAGHFAELGVWRGGASIYTRLVLNTLREYERRVYVFDAFESIKGYGQHQNFLSVREKDVKHNSDKYNATNSVFFHKGMFRDTTPAFARDMTEMGEKLAVLRIDGKFYESYESAMYDLYPLVPVGGTVIFDDVYSHAAVLRFWNDFKKDYGLLETLTRIDVHSGWFTKIQDVRLDRAKMRHTKSKSHA